MKMLREYIQRHKDWSLSTFGEGRRTEGLCKHIAKELDEIRQSPSDLTEWIDVIILALDGAWRAGYSPLQIVNALIEKQAINFYREWEKKEENEPTEHKRIEVPVCGDCHHSIGYRNNEASYSEWECACSCHERIT